MSTRPALAAILTSMAIATVPIIAATAPSLAATVTYTGKLGGEEAASYQAPL
jgi:hypothetical protein